MGQHLPIFSAGFSGLLHHTVRVVIKRRELIEPSYLADEFEKALPDTCLTSEQMAEAVMTLESVVHQAGFITAQISCRRRMSATVP